MFAENLLASGVELIQLRNKMLSRSKCLEICAEILKLRLKYQAARIVINDCVSIAKELSADGVHLGQNDECPLVARQALGKEAIVGLSNHSLEDIRNAPVDSLDYLALGPIFPSKTKSGHAEVVGLELLGKAAKISPLPLVAIGGITLDSARDVFLAGAQSCAIISDLSSVSKYDLLTANSKAVSGMNIGSLEYYRCYLHRMLEYRNETLK